MRRVVAVVLAGGASSRFGGTPKAFVSLRGRPMIAWVIATLSELTDDIAVEIGGQDRALYTDLGLPLLSSSTGARGPLAGVHAALAWGEHASELVAIAPCDVPGIEAHTYERLLSEVTRRECEGAYVEMTDGAHPLNAVLRSRLRTKLEPILECQILPSVRDCFRSNGILSIACEGKLVNVNTIEDLTEAARLAKARRYWRSATVPKK